MFTVEELVAKVREIAKSRPDTIYTGTEKGCEYNAGRCSDGSIGCLFGQAMKELGEHYLEYGGYIDSVLSGNLKIAKNSDPKVLWCRKVQYCQDNSRSWGSSVEYADTLCPEV